MTERTGLTTQRGAPVTLVGDEVKVGDKAPDFTVVSLDGREVHLSDYRGKVCILSAVPSIDTSVCSVETRRFDAMAGQIPEVEILTISMDLPFAQKRWAENVGLRHVTMLSDHREASFGNAYGMIMKGQRLLARGLYVVDREGRIAYTQLVPDTTQEPNYDEVIAAAKRLV